MSAVSFDACGIRLRHALAFAGQIRHRCVINKEAAKRVAKDLGLDVAQTEGAVRLLRKLASPPSPERLALVAMRDPGLDDADIAEMFDRSVRWASLVRERADELRTAEPLPEYLEYLDEGLRPSDPTPSEILARAKELRELRPAWVGPSSPGPGGIRSLQWSGYAFVSVSAG